LGCGKKERPLEDLSAPELRQLLDSLLQVENSERKLHRNIPVIVTATIKPGEGLFQVMQQAKLDNKNIIKIISALSDSVELTKLRVGEKFQVGLDPDNLQRVLTFRYSPNPALAHFLILGSNDSLVYKKMDKPTTLRHRLYKGVLENGSSLDATLRKVGINSRMVQVVNGVLMCKVSFSTNAHPGDQFEVLIEERVFQDSIWIEGQVVYASFRGKSAGFHEAFHYDDGDPKSTFNAHYTESGEALVFSGLRYPLDRLHISSAFGMRLHPVLGRREMHWGVDYSSPAGTPVFSVAEGIVIESGFDPASGNKVAVRHKDNTSSWYLHLSSRSVSKGQRVGSRQIVGRVGSTGRSTGPHLHFGFKQPNGAWMSPLSKRMIATPKLEGERFSRLKQQIATIRALLLKNRTPKKPA
jgi:murein DD-endopeptidase MepM/ murein hydrolase activator NlpD